MAALKDGDKDKEVAYWVYTPVGLNVDFASEIELFAFYLLEDSCLGLLICSLRAFMYLLI